MLLTPPRSITFLTSFDICNINMGQTKIMLSLLYISIYNSYLHCDMETTSKIKITRSRTAQSRTRAANSSARPTLHEVWKDPTKKKRKQDSDGSEQNKKQKNKPQAATTDAGTSVKPANRSIGLQVISCDRCKGLGHTPTLCPDNSDTTSSTPNAVFCSLCKLTSRYEGETMKIEVQLCPAHIPAVVESSSFKKKERVRDFLKKIDNMVNAGASLDDALSYMGITSEKYKRYQKYLQ